MVVATVSGDAKKDGVQKEESAVAVASLPVDPHALLSAIAVSASASARGTGSDSDVTTDCEWGWGWRVVPSQLGASASAPVGVLASAAVSSPWLEAVGEG